jgi:hypothetical protein
MMLLDEARWQIAGSTVDVADNANIVGGLCLVTHDQDIWHVEEVINEVQDRYDVVPPATGAPATSFTGVNGVAGLVHGAYVFFEDVTLKTYRSDDGRYTGCEAIRRVSDDRYESRGAMFLDAKHVSSWSYTLQRI